MHLSTLIARRYLFARKSHNVINIISLISGIGIALGTCALIIVMSVYNGFQEIVKDAYRTIESDFIITPSAGKYFPVEDSFLDSLRADGRIASFQAVLSEKVFVTYNGSRSIAVIKGVDTAYESLPSVQSGITEGRFDLYEGEIPSAVVGRSLARKLRLSPRFLDPLEIYFPGRGRKVSIVNPMSSLNQISLFPTGVISLEQQMDKETVFIPIGEARILLECEGMASSVEIYVAAGCDSEDVEASIRSSLPGRFVLKNRYQQNETVYRMMKYEKAAIYMILLFIIIIISCNVFGSLTMLIIEKEDDIETLKSLGARNSLLKRVFVSEGWMITLYGIAAGTVLGVVLSLVQQIFGVIALPGNYIIQAYPVILRPGDIVLTVFSIALIGFVIACIPSLKLFSSKK